MSFQKRYTNIYKLMNWGYIHQVCCCFKAVKVGFGKNMMPKGTYSKEEKYDTLIKGAQIGRTWQKVINFTNETKLH